MSDVVSYPCDGRDPYNTATTFTKFALMLMCKQSGYYTWKNAGWYLKTEMLSKKQHRFNQGVARSI